MGSIYGLIRQSNVLVQARGLYSQIEINDYPLQTLVACPDTWSVGQCGSRQKMQDQTAAVGWVAVAARTGCESYRLFIIQL